MTAVAGGVAVVTGGASGIGLALGAALVERGALVALADLDGASVEAAAASIGASAFVVDVADAASVGRLAADVERELGAARLVASNAGVASSAPLERMEDSDWLWLLGVNVLGLSHVTRAFLPQLRASSGHMLVTGSMSGLAAAAGTGGYGASKFAVTAMAEVLAVELAPDVDVTLLAPGPVRTRLGSSSRNRATGPGGLQDVDLTLEAAELPWMEPADVATIALDAVERDALYAITHPELIDQVRARHRRIEAAFVAAAG